MVLHNKIAYITNIIGQRCDEQGIFSEAAAHLMQFPQIGSQQGISLRFRHIGRQFLVGKNLVAVPHIRQMVSVPAFRFLDTGHRLVEQPGIRRGNPGLGKQLGNKGKGQKPKGKQFASHKAVLS